MTENTVKAWPKYRATLHQDIGLHLRPGDTGTGRIHVLLRGYADAAYGCTKNGRSKLSYCFDLVPIQQDGNFTAPLSERINTAMFHMKSQVGERTSLSSTDAEHTVIVELIKTAILFRGVLEELRQTQFQPTPVYNDNKSTITMGSTHSGNSKRLRYMLPRINWLLEQVDAGIVQLQHMDTALLPPDIGTKRLTEDQHKLKRAAVQGTALPL